MALEVSLTTSQQIRRLPKLYPREEYIQRIARLHAVAKTQNWTFRELGAAKYAERKAMWRKMLKDPKLDTAWLISWDRQINRLLRKGVKPQQIENLMVVQAHMRQYGEPPGYA
jgi:hypothetical protein